MQKALYELPGVAQVEVQGTKKAIVKVDASKIKEEDVKSALAKQGYPSTVQKT